MEKTKEFYINHIEDCYIKAYNSQSKITDFKETKFRKK